MSENRKLLWWIGGIFGVSCVLIVGVIAHDRQIDKCIVDHIFDFHLDADHAMQEIDADKAKKEVEAAVKTERDRRHQKFVDEVPFRPDGNAFDSSRDDRGTIDRPGDSRD